MFQDRSLMTLPCKKCNTHPSSLFLYLVSPASMKLAGNLFQYDLQVFWLVEAIIMNLFSVFMFEFSLFAPFDPIGQPAIMLYKSSFVQASSVIL